MRAKYDAARFSKATADVTGDSERKVQLEAHRGESIGEELLNKVARTSLDTGEELDALIRLSPQQRTTLIERAAALSRTTGRPAETYGASGS
jgi:hypothetical protein